MDIILGAAGKATWGMMKSVLPSVYIGLFLGAMVGRRGLPSKVMAFIPAIMRVTGLSLPGAISILLAIADRTAGMAALAMAYKREQLSEQEVIAANLTAKAPAVLQFFVFSFVPIMVAMYPWALAVRFLIVYFLAFGFVSAVGILYARLVVQPSGMGCIASYVSNPGVPSSWSKTLLLSARDVWRPFIGMSCWLAGMSFAVMVVLKADVLHDAAGRFATSGVWGLDSVMLPLVGTGLVSMLGGVAAVGAAFHDGLAPTSMVVPLLLLTSLLHNFYDFFASSLPRTTAIFGKRLGLKVGIIGFIVTQMTMLLFIILTITGIV